MTVSADAAQDGPGIAAQSFEAEIRPHLRTLHHRAFRLTRDMETANDLVQDALERGYRKLDRYQQGTNLRAWLLQIMRNLWINGHRRQAGGPDMVSLELIDEVSLHRRASKDDSRWSNVEACVVDRLSETSILAVIDSLPDHFRHVVVLADVEGATYESIATTLDIPLGSVASRLFRARRRLRQQICEQFIALERLERAG